MLHNKLKDDKSIIKRNIDAFNSIASTSNADKCVKVDRECQVYKYLRGQQ